MKRDYLKILSEYLGSKGELKDFGTYGAFEFHLQGATQVVTLDDAGYFTVRCDGILRRLGWLPESKGTNFILSTGWSL